MLDAAITADLVLVGAGMENPTYKGSPLLIFGKEYFIDMFFGIVIIMTVAGNAAQYDPLVFLHPIY